MFTLFGWISRCRSKKPLRNHFAYAGKVDGFIYHNRPADDKTELKKDAEQKGELPPHKYKLRVNLEEKCFVENQEAIIEAINKAAVEAKLDNEIPSYKYADVDKKQFEKLEKEEKFWKALLETPQNTGLIYVVRGELDSAVYQENKAEIEQAYQRGNLMELANEKYTDLHYKNEHQRRFINKGQFTVYLSDNANPNAMAEKIGNFIVCLEKEFKNLKLISSKAVNDTDSPLSEFVTFRQEQLNGKSVRRFLKDEDYNFIYKPAELKQLKEQQESSELYQFLVKKCQTSNIYATKPVAKTVGVYAQEFSKKEREEERVLLRKRFTI